MKPLDLTKPLQTRDGRPAKFLHKLDNPNSLYPISCVVGDPGKETVEHYSSTGEFCANQHQVNANDLINVPVKHVREYWVNLYTNDEGGLHRTKGIADANAVGGRLACKKITIEFENEGLDGFKEPNQERWDEVVKK